MKDEKITAAELNELMQRDERLLLVDVLTPEDYAVQHIAGACNACVYEMVFLEQLAAKAPEKDLPVIVYDASGRTLTAATAREKLLQAGYRSVAILEGGMAAWQAAGLPMEIAQAAPAAGPVSDGLYRLDLEKSRVEWIGRNLNNRHSGRIAFAAGEVTVKEGVPVGGCFAIDMTTIQNADLQDATWRDLLIKHLLSEDFFAVATYPRATFVLRQWQPIAGAAAGCPNGVITGDLTIKETARELRFPAIVMPQDDGTVKAHGFVDLDRTQWGVHYGSGRLFERLGMHLVNDLISIELFIVAGLQG
jgi:rhodanese-related sulfurtransferase